MKLSAKTRYGTIAQVDLDIHYGKKLVILRDIAQRQQIPLQFLEHIVPPLISARILKNTRGPRGGIGLAKSPVQIRLSDVINILEGSVSPVECVINPKVCNRSNFCVTRDIWCEIKEKLEGILEATTLQDLVEKYRKKEQHKSVMYYI